MTHLFIQKTGLVVMGVLMGMLSLTGCATNRELGQKKNEEKIDIGYGKIDRDRMAGAVSVIDAEKARQTGATSVADMLTGRVAGVQVISMPGGGFKVRIRGKRSIHGQDDPLFVVDGMPLMHVNDGILYDMNPYDIESITVLKDIASTAIYGMRGANGVILITTKRGR